MSRKRLGFKHYVDQYTETGEFVKRWDSCTDAAKAFGTSQGNISNAARKERKTAQGFVWNYVNEIENACEEWRYHSEGFEVSNLGRVKISENCWSTGQAERNGYSRLRMTVKGIRKNFSVHRLVGETWFPDEKERVDLLCDGKAVIDHKDKNRSNNKLSNLEWVTPRENALRRYK